MRSIRTDRHRPERRGGRRLAVLAGAAVGVLVVAGCSAAADPDAASSDDGPVPSEATTGSTTEGTGEPDGGATTDAGDTPEAPPVGDDDEAGGQQPQITEVDVVELERTLDDIDQILADLELGFELD